MQLFSLTEDPAEKENLLAVYPKRVEALLKLLSLQVDRGRCTAGEGVASDGEVKFLPAGVSVPQ